ncbi:DUF3575 domain-containing protein [Chitinophaga sp. SYP-B3965]|uniref:DUF3575 domain-containing protein n=1 Tax=Chitinophaga sp. SYP-B3965 TaxID=2663120 RepID=UPI001299880F|nr:DUF3575 domain-containing protein [Chitinophaga sp. SYP-B3965]MRG46888.1 DUF3575 domain-containing protein [Chitinophaga sp. SYP-B3965]
MFRTLCFLCLFYLAASSAAAQNKRSHWPKRPQKRPPPVVIPPKPGLVISSNLFSLHEPDGGPSLGLEYRASLHWAVMVEGTAILYTTVPRDAAESKGFRIQPELRYYFSGKHRTFRGFFSLQGMYKQTTFPDSTFKEVPSSTNPSRSVYESVYYESKKEVFGGSANIGFQARFGKANRFMVEMYAGLGLKSKDYFGKPIDAKEPMDKVIKVIPEFDKAGTYPHIPMGVRMGYCF